MKTKFFEILKKLKVLFDTYKMILVVATIGLTGVGAGYYVNEPEPIVPEVQPPIGKQIDCGMKEHLQTLH